ncbi:MAG: ATP-grasp domain-containing protein [Clostridiales bacterium]|jgi:predicted ATP-grasp superfamily ATP-dependent carboligase|nr:ATP-grasp domain-containing protein [Clostridiales bacterium]
MNKKKTQVIVTDTHTRMALSVIRELGQAGYEVISVTSDDIKKPLGHASRYAKKKLTLPKEYYAEALLSLSKTFMKKDGQRPVLLPTGMFTLNIAAARRGEFTESFKCLLPTAEALYAAGDKPAVMRTARSLGLYAPEEYPIGSPVFPCVIKYRNGEALNLRANYRYAVVDNTENYFSILDKMSEKGEVFVSRYVQGRAYGVSAVLDKNSEPLAVFCHARVREYPASGGPACCAESIWDERLVEPALKLLRASKLSGFAMVEFKGTLERPYILEINPRIWGTYPLSRLSGAGMAVAYVKAATEKNWGKVPERISFGDEADDIIFIDPSYEEDKELICKYKTGVRMQYLANDFMRWRACKGKKFAGVANNTSAADGFWRDFLLPGTKGGVFDWRDLPGTAAYGVRLLKRGME